MSAEMRETHGIESENEAAILESEYQKGVKNLYEKGVTRVPNKYLLPVHEQPNNDITLASNKDRSIIALPVIDFAELQGPSPKRSNVLKSLARACEEYGFFQLVNHPVPTNVILSMVDVCKRFFELPYVERSKYMSPDMLSPVRYGTSFNQNKDEVFCWRDFLKMTCHPLSENLPHWPSSPPDMRNLAATYAKETKHLYVRLMEAILESLGLYGSINCKKTLEEDTMKEFHDGSQLMVVNCYPPCPEPDLTLGMPPHSDFGFLTLLLQDDVQGLQIQHKENWVTVQPIANSFVINVGDQLEVFSNGKYKSVLHRVLVNQTKSRISVASLHSHPTNSIVEPAPELINEANPRRYKGTDLASFLEYISSCEPKKKNFLESRKLT